MNADNKLLEIKVPEFELRDETLLDGLWKLGRIPVPFGFGFEAELKARSTDPNIPERGLSLHLQNKSAKEILDALCEADPRYTWTMDESTVNVFPKNIATDPRYLLLDIA